MDFNIIYLLALSAAWVTLTLTVHGDIPERCLLENNTWMAEHSISCLYHFIALLTFIMWKTGLPASSLQSARPCRRLPYVYVMFTFYHPKYNSEDNKDFCSHATILCKMSPFINCFGTSTAFYREYFFSIFALNCDIGDHIGSPTIFSESHLFFACFSIWGH